MSDQHDDMTEDELEASILADEQAAATVVQTTTAARPDLGDPGPVWDDVVGQSTAVQQLRAAAARGVVHAYLFVGPSGSTKIEAARAFAASLMSGGESRDSRDARLILAGEHPAVRDIYHSRFAVSIRFQVQLARRKACGLECGVAADGPVVRRA